MNERTIYTYWLASALSIAVGLLIWPPALFLAMAVTSVHSLHFLLHPPRIGAFPMQVRIGFLGLLVLGQAPYFGWVNWIQLAGTTALLTVGYCPLARVLSLMPWNRTHPMSWKLFVTAIFPPPVEGSILELVSPESSS
jgi:hypothetical protein